MFRNSRLWAIEKTVWLVAVGVLLTCSDVCAEGPANFMMLANVDGQMLEGQPLLWDSSHMFLLGRDGALHEFHPDSAKNARKTKRNFHSYTTSEMQNRLREEFGHGFDVSTTQHFVVVHPRGPWSTWADRMESLYRSFIRGMQVRGIDTHDPQVSLVAIVFRTRADYYAYAAAHGSPLQPGTLGHYDPKSNRIFLYDDGHSTNNLATIVHEATHQTAYNVGAHRRFAVQPSWLVEGLAMMFETPGMREGWSIHTRKDRINQGRLHYYQQNIERRPKNALLQLVTSDQMFRTDAGTAYAEAWMLTFYLYETRSREYSAYLARVAARPIFSTYPAQERLKDFAAAFGSDFDLLDAHLRRFAAELRTQY